MNRKIVVWVTAAAMAFSLTACSGGAAPIDTPKPAPAEEAAPAETGGLDQTTLQACLDIAGPFAAASAAMASAAGGSDAQSAVDAWTALVDALGSIATSSSSAEVASAASAAQADFAAVRDAMQKVYVDGDLSAAGELTTASTKMQNSYTALLDLCSA